MATDYYPILTRGLDYHCLNPTPHILYLANIYFAILKLFHKHLSNENVWTQAFLKGQTFVYFEV